MGKGSNTTTNQSTSSADPQAAALYRDLLTRAQGVASTPYQAYTGDLVAPINAQQNTGIAGINSAAGYANPYIQQAASQATASSSPITAETIQQYQNPYTQQVIDATTAQMRNDFGQQQAALTGNQIAQGALGGNATGVARGILGGQQGRTMASTVAGLYDKSYQQALSAAQQQQQTGMAGANALANYGISGQTAALQGAGAQINAGSLQQQNQQAQLDAAYGQYLQQQAYPYAQTQWLAGLGTGVGSNLGGTSYGTTTGPAPNQTAQWLGLGLTGLSMLSDERAKEDIEDVGALHDGTPIYRYRYKGSPQWHVGPIAQDVEERHPQAVSRGVDGMRYVDMHEATEDSVERAAGGGVQSPWADAKGWIPTIGIAAGRGAPSGGAPSLGGSKEGSFDPSKLASGISGAMKGVGGLDWAGLGSGSFGGEAWGGGNFLSGSAYGGSGEAPLPGLSAEDYGAGFAAGGAVDDPGSDYNRSLMAEAMVDDPESAYNRDLFDATVDDPNSAYNRGLIRGAGQPSEDQRAIGYDMLRRGEGVRAPDAIPGGEPPPGHDLPVFDESGRMLGNQTSAQGQVPVQQGAPVVGADEDGGEAPVGVAGRTGGAGGSGVTAFAPNGPGSYPAMPDAVRRPVPQDDERFGLGLLPISRNAGLGLMTAGLGMMASRSPFLGNAVGEGGITGLSAYGAANEADRKAAAEAEKLSREAAKLSFDQGMANRKQGETERHNQATEKNAASDRSKAPMGMRFNATGELEPIPGWIPTLEKAAKARKGPEGEVMDDQTAQFMADRIIAGDTKVLTGLGRGAQGAANILKVQKLVAQRAASGEEISRAAREMLQNAAQFEGLKTAERTQAGIMSKLSVYGRTAFNATDIALRLSNDVDRTQFMPVNKIINAAREKTGDPKIVALGQALMTLTNEYARAIGGGHGTVHDKEAAERRLSAAQTKEQLKAVIDVMRQEILAEEKAMPAARQHIRDIYNPRPGGGVKSIAGEHGAPTPSGPVPGASGFQPPAGAIPRQYQGKTYYYDPQTKQPYPGQ